MLPRLTLASVLWLPRTLPRPLFAAPRPLPTELRLWLLSALRTALLSGRDADEALLRLLDGALLDGRPTEVAPLRETEALRELPLKLLRLEELLPTLLRELLTLLRLEEEECELLPDRLEETDEE